jgi:MipA family protein
VTSKLGIDSNGVPVLALGMIKNTLLKILLCSVSVCSWTASKAQPQPSDQDWKLSAGVAARLAPRSIGSGQDRFLVVPNFDVKYKDWFFFNPIEGVGLRTSSNSLTLSGSLGVDLNYRSAKDNPVLRGFEKVGIAPALRLKAQYDTGPVGLSATSSTRIADHDANGSTLTLEASYRAYASRQMIGIVGANARFMDQNFAQNFVSVSVADSVSSGKAQYRAKSGLLDTGVFVQGIFILNREWAIVSRWQISQLSTNAANSPAVEKKIQNTLLVATSYSF